MLNTASVELTNSGEKQDLTWKTVKRGSRSSSRLRKPAMKPEVGQQQDDKSTKKEPAPVSQSEKNGPSVLGRRFADRIELVPIKKRRLLFQSSPTPSQNPPPNIGEIQSTQTQSSQPAEDSASGQCSGLDSVASSGPAAVQGTQDLRNNPQVPANIKHEVSASGQCSGSDPVSGCNGAPAAQLSGGTEDGKIPQVAKVKTEVSTSAQCSSLDSVPRCNGPAAVQFSQGTLEGHLSGKIPQVANIKLEHCSDFDSGGDAARRSMIDDTVGAKGSPTMGSLSKPVAADLSQTGSPLEKVSTPEKAAALIQEAPAPNDNSDDSKVHTRDDDTRDAKGSPHNTRHVASDSSLTSLTLEKAATAYESSNMVVEPSVNNDCIDDPNSHTLQAGASVKFQEEGDRDDNNQDAKRSLTMDDSRSVVTDSSLTTPSLEKAATTEGATNLVQETVAHDDGSDDSNVHVKCANMSVKCDGDTEANKVTARKDVRLNWDLNTIMESWDDDCEEGMPQSDEQRANLEKVQCDNAVEFSNHSSAGAEASAQAVSMDNLTMGTAQFEIRSGIFLDPVVSQKIGPETNKVQSKDDLRQIFDAPNKGISCRESLTMASYQMMEVEYPASKLGKTGSFQASPEHDNLSASGTTFEEGQPVVADVAGGNKETPAPDAAQKDNSMHVKREQIPKSYDFLGEASVEDCDYGYDSDVSQGAHGHTVGIKNRRGDNQSGYESPFEDGELRELDALAREENEENEVGFETECVDYDLDDRDADEFDAPNHCMSEIASEIAQNDKGSSTEKLVDSVKLLNESNYLSTEISGDQLPDGPEDIDRSFAAGNVASQENVTPDQVDGLTVKSSSVGEVGPRETRERVFRQPEEPLYSGGTQHRERNTYMQRNRYRYEPSFNSGKVFGSGRPIRRHQDESQGGRQWVGSYGNIRKLPPTSNEYPVDDEDSRPRHINSNSVEKGDGQTHRFQRRLVHTTNNPSNNYRQPFVRRRSPSDRDDTYSTRGRGVENRDGSNFRSRGRPGMYRQGVSRGPRDEYGPMGDGVPSSVQQPHYTARRDRSFSPVNRDNNFSHPRRRSRSRSRSPPMWHVQRDRSMGVSPPPSRSMEFRSDPRMERVRPTFRKSNFAADDDEFMASPPRNRFSPQSNNSRWIDDRKRGAPNFRGRKMSGRFSTRNERFHDEGSPEPPMKSDDSYRSTTRPGRFSEMSGGRGRGRRYDNTNDRMKYRERYDFPQRPRHYDTSPVPRRFSNATEDCSENEGERVRDTDGRDAPLRSMEERCPPPLRSMEERGPPRFNKESMEERGPPPRFNKERMYG